MPKFLVKESFRGAVNGIHVVQFRAGSVSEIHDPDLARVALANGWIESHVEGLAEPAAPKNKALKKSPKAKGDASE